MDVALMFPSKYIKAVELKGKDVTLTIAKVVLEDLAQEDGNSKSKGVVYFEGTKKGWVLNRTNANSVAAMFGRETDSWIGKRVVLYPAPFNDPFTGEKTVAVRVRGSPDIEKDLAIEIQLPRRKPIRAVMRATGKRPAANGKKTAPPPVTSPEPTPGHDPLTGEVSEETPFPPADEFAGAAQ